MRHTCSTCIFFNSNVSDWLKWLKAEEEYEPCKKCKTISVDEYSNWKPPKITNSDRIRSMTDDELADFLLHICDWKWREWLKEEVKDG